MRRFRLKGWQRIGIVLSVIWLIVGPVWGLILVHNLLWFVGVSDPYVAATFALLPIPFLWLFLYIVVWTVRWVRRGFQPST